MNRRPPLQQFTAKAFHALRGAVARVRSHPRVAPWIADADDSASTRADREMHALLYHERMIADRPRMDFYYAAIERQVHPGDRVVDLGTGTGVLAAWSSRRGAERVYAVEKGEIIEYARILAEANRIENLEFVPMHSAQFRPDRPVDVIVHEQMGDFLFEEDMVANVTELRDRVLAPGGRIVPALFDVYCEPVMFHDGRVNPFIWDLDVHGYDYSSLRSRRPTSPLYYQRVGHDPFLVRRFLGEPRPLLSVDLHTVVESAMPRSFEFTRRVTEAGRLDGLALYFDSRVDDLVLTTSPIDTNRASHWGFLILRTETETVAAGEQLHVSLTVEKWTDPATWKWDVRRA